MPTELKITENLFNIKKGNQSEKNTIASNIDNTFIENTRINYTAQEIRKQAKQILENKQKDLENLLKNTTESSESIDEIFNLSNIKLEQKEILNDMTFFADQVHACRELELLHFGRITPEKLDDAGLYKDHGNSLLLQATNAFVNRRNKKSQQITLTAMSHKNPRWDAFVGKTLSNTAKEHIKINLCSLHDNLPKAFMDYLTKKGYDIQSNKIKNILKELQSLQTESNAIFCSSRSKLKYLVGLKKTENIGLIEKHKKQANGFANIIREKLDQQTINANQIKELQEQLKNIDSKLHIINDTIRTNSKILNSETKLQDFTKVMEEIRNKFSIDCKESESIEKTIISLNSLHKGIENQIQSLQLTQQKLAVSIKKSFSEFNKILQHIGGTKVSSDNFNSKDFNFLQKIETDYVKELDNIINGLTKSTTNADLPRTLIGKTKAFISSLLMFWKSPSTLFGGIIGGVSITAAMYAIGASIICCLAGGLIGAFIGIAIAHIFIKTQDVHIKYSKDELSATHTIENIAHSQKEMNKFLELEAENYTTFKQEVTNQNNSFNDINNSYNDIMKGQENFKKMAEDFIKSFGTMNNLELQEEIIRNHFSDKQVIATVICSLVKTAFNSNLDTYTSSKNAQYKELPKEIFEYIDKYIVIKHNDSKDDDLLNGSKIFTTLITNKERIANINEVGKALKSSISSNVSQIQVISETSFSDNTNCEELNQMAKDLSNQKDKLIEERNDLFIKMAHASIKDKNLRELTNFTQNLNSTDVNQQIKSINEKIINYNKKTKEFKEHSVQVTKYTKLYNKYTKARSVYNDNYNIANGLGIPITKLEQVLTSDQLTLNNTKNFISDICIAIKSIETENTTISKLIENKINTLMKSLPDNLHKELETVLKGNSQINTSESIQSADNITKYFTNFFDNEDIKQYLPLISKLYESNSKNLVENKMVIDAEYIASQLNRQCPLFSFDVEKITITFKAFDEYMRIKLIINASKDNAQLKDMLSKIEKNINPNSVTYDEVIKSGAMPKLVNATKSDTHIETTENIGQFVFQSSFISSSNSFDHYFTNETTQDVNSISFKNTFNTLETAVDYKSFQDAREKLIGNTNSINEKVLKQSSDEKIKEMFCQLFTSISNQATLDGIKSGYKIPSMSSVQYFIRAIILLLQELNFQSVKTGTTIDTILDKFQGIQKISYQQDGSSFVEMIKNSIKKYTGSKAKALEENYRTSLQNKNVTSLNEISTNFEKMMELVNFIYSTSTKNEKLVESIRSAYEKIQFKKLNDDFFTKQHEEMRSIVYFEENALWNNYISGSKNAEFSCYCVKNKIDIQKVKYTDRNKFKLPKEQWQLVFSDIKFKESTKKEYTFQEIQQYIPLDLIKKITLKRSQDHLDFERMIASWAHELNVETLLKNEDSLRITLNRASMLLMTINSDHESTNQGKGLENSNISQKALQCAITAFEKDIRLYLGKKASSRKLFSYNEQILVNYLHNLLILIKTHSELDSTTNKPIACHVENEKLKYVKTKGLLSVDSAEIIEKIIEHIPNFEKLDIQSTVDDNVANFVYNNTEQSDYDITFFKQLNEYININTCRELSQCDSTVALNKLNKPDDIQNYAINISFRLAVLMKKKHFLEDSQAMKESFINDKLEKIFPSKKIKEYIDQLLSNKEDKGFSTPVLINLLTLIPVLTKKIFLASDNTLKFDFTKINNTKLSGLQLKDVSHRTVNYDMINGILFQVLSKDDILRIEDTAMYNRFIQSMYISYIIERLKFNEVKLTESIIDKNVKRPA